MTCDIWKRLIFVRIFMVLKLTAMKTKSIFITLSDLDESYVCSSERELQLLKPNGTHTEEFEIMNNIDLMLCVTDYEKTELN